MKMFREKQSISGIWGLPIHVKLMFIIFNILFISIIVDILII